MLSLHCLRVMTEIYHFDIRPIKVLPGTDNLKLYDSLLRKLEIYVEMTLYGYLLTRICFYNASLKTRT